MWRTIFTTGLVIASLSSLTWSAVIENDVRSIGVAKVDITPEYPIRLTGYGNRREEYDVVEQRIWAKAIAIGADSEEPAILITVDNCGIPDSMRAEVLSRLAKKAGIKPDRFAICFSHTHCAPCLSGALVNIFSLDIPDKHQAHIDRYSLELTNKLEEVSLAALAERKPGLLTWSTGSVSFARNRRAAWGGPVDHSMPVMFVHSPEGNLRAIFANYACHATTLSFNNIHGDWPGTAMEAIEREHSGVIAMVSIGCGADQNPHPRGTVELAWKHGVEVAAEVSRLLKGDRTPIRGQLTSQDKNIFLPYDTLPTREAWGKLAASTTPQVAYAARKNAARLDSGKTLLTELAYRVQVWNFGNDLAMVFLPGEVTVDYQLRLKVELDPKRLWVNAYANDAPCYIPSERVLAEGGYEGATAMVYYDRPAKFASGIEDRIVNTVHELIPPIYRAHYRADVPPKSPAESLAAIKTRDGFVVELVAAEPFVSDPIAIDWDVQGRMWVVEQPDYPNGIDGNWKPGGRVKILTDTDNDRRYDKSTLILEGIPFPTGITCWRNGAFVCSAPDILYIEDTDSDGRADRIEKLFSGFHTDNYNARINSLSLGLDNWIHGANGLLGGKIRSEKTGQVIDINGRDVRFHPETGVLRLVSGVTQQGRARDDWDNWFGCSNSRWIFHFPLPDRYVQRNPHVPGVGPTVYLPFEDNKTILNPISQTFERFNSPASQGHITSATGLGIYRDVLLGSEFEGNAFIGEVAHNLVRRYRLEPHGATFEAHRPVDEANSEFLASADNWTRPVQVRTGPDGALYIVDMYRAVIEHTRWIPADRLAKLDPRAGDTMGRIYRVFPKGGKLRPIQDLTKLDTIGLVAALESPNGTTRDLVHSMLLKRSDDVTRASLKKLALSSKLSAVRVQALSILDGIEALTISILTQALHDADPQVRRHAVRLGESRLASTPELAAEFLKLVNDADFTVRYQLALSLGEWDASQAAFALGELARTAMSDSWFRAAVVSSSNSHPLEVLAAVSNAPSSTEGRTALISQLVATAAAIATQPSDFERLLDFLATTKEKPHALWQISVMSQLQDALDKRGIPLASLNGSEKVRSLFEMARRIAADEKASEADREAAIRLLGRGFNDAETDLPLLVHFLSPTIHDRLQKAALSMLSRTSNPNVATAVLKNWSQRVPSLRAAIITTLLSRDEWTLQLLHAIEKGDVKSAEVPASNQSLLASHTNEAIRRLSQKILPIRNAIERAKIIEEYQVVSSLRGDAIRGAAVFKNKCLSCHSYLGQGMAVGPDLKAFYNKSSSDFLTAILDPNAAIEPRYASYVVITEDDRTISGIITNETSSHFELVQPGGLRENILRVDNPELRATGLSLMPEGLEQGIEPQAMADLIAYLKSGG